MGEGPRRRPWDRDGGREPWRRDDWGPSTPLPVVGGLRAKSRRGRIGETWWSQRFVAALEALVDGGRLDRGRNYARRGQVVSLDVQPGNVTAVVQGSRTTPYTVRLTVKLLNDGQWRRAEEAIASQAVFLARLLSGEMPDEIEEAFAASGLTLFPSARADLRALCSCPDWGNPCKHAAAAYYLLAEAFDADPFLILAWRGRPRERLLTDLRALRDAAVEAERASAVTAAIEPSPAGSFWEPGPGFDDLRFDPRSDVPPDALLLEIAPFAPRLGFDLGAVLAPVYRTIAEAATASALGRDGKADEAT